MLSKQDAEAAVIAYLDEHPGWYTAHDIYACTWEATDRGQSWYRTQLSGLAGQGRIQCHSVPGNVAKFASMATAPYEASTPERTGPATRAEALEILRQVINDTSGARWQIEDIYLIFSQREHDRSRSWVEVEIQALTTDGYVHSDMGGRYRAPYEIGSAAMR